MTQMEAIVCQSIATVCGIDATQVGADSRLADLGVDSLAAAEVLVNWQNRAQFFGVASQVMRRILVDRARARKVAKRSGRWARVAFDEAVVRGMPRDVDLLDLDFALKDLATFDPRMSNVAELRFFGGLTLREAADGLSLSVATVEREWQAARSWLFARLTRASRATK
jgi:RNA polymerase sigma-70 factor, ECF subfamily